MHVSIHFCTDAHNSVPGGLEYGPHLELTIIDFGLLVLNMVYHWAVIVALGRKHPHTHTYTHTHNST
jgi:hypothetical protein